MHRQKYFSSRATHVLAGVGISLASFLVVLGVFFAGITVVKLIRALIESRFDAIVISAQRAEEASAPATVPRALRTLPGQSPVISHESSVISNNLTFASFSDLFSSTGGIDRVATTMYRDDAATAFLFPPALTWSERSDTNDQSLIINNQLSCIGGSCLAVKGAALVKNGAVIALPGAPDGVENVSADVVGGAWVVGIVRKEGDRYAGYAYRFDGRSFAPLFPNEKAFESEYKGTWGFGGNADDFLAVYGAYQGKGYRVRSSSEGLTSVIRRLNLRNDQSAGWQITDLSWLFDVRIMRGGIIPGITKAGEGIHAAWYLWNKERNGRAVFVKLFQNGAADIQGEVDLLSAAPYAFSYFALMGASGSFPYSLVGYGEQNGVSSAWDIRDQGFAIPSGTVTVTSVDLNNYRAEVPHVLQLGLREFSAGGAAVSLAVTNTKDGAWEPIQMGGGLWFRNPRGTALKWKMTVAPGTNPEYTPFIGILDLNYEVSLQG